MKKLSIILHTWDRYKDVRAVFFETFERYWNDCPYEFVMSCNADISGEKRRGKLVICPDNSNDVQRMIAAVQNTETKYILLFHEDAIFMDRIHSGDIEEIVNFMDEKEIVFCKMVPTPNGRGKAFKEAKHIRRINKRQVYGLNVLCSIYERNYLLEILGDGENDSWYMENAFIEAAVSAEKGFYEDKVVVTTNPLHVFFGVEKGMWNRRAIRIMKKQGIVPDKSRKVKSLGKDVMDNLILVSYSIIPNIFRIPLKKTLRSFGMKFTTEK